MPVGGAAALEGAKRGDRFIPKHPDWATSHLADLAVERANLRSRINVSKFFSYIFLNIWGKGVRTGSLVGIGRKL